MISAVADTHSVVWYLFGDPRLSNGARRAFDEALAVGQRIAVSTITLAELIYLIEKGRLAKEVLPRLWQLLDEEVLLVETPFDRRVAAAMQQVERDEIPDLPDRIIAATGVRLGVPVISRDSKIQRSKIPSIW